MNASTPHTPQLQGWLWRTVAGFFSTQQREIPVRSWTAFQLVNTADKHPSQRDYENSRLALQYIANDLLSHQRQLFLDNAKIVVWEALVPPLSYNAWRGSWSRFAWLIGLHPKFIKVFCELSGGQNVRCLMTKLLGQATCQIFLQWSYSNLFHFLASKYW